MNNELITKNLATLDSATEYIAKSREALRSGDVDLALEQLSLAQLHFDIVRSRGAK